MQKVFSCGAKVTLVLGASLLALPAAAQTSRPQGDAQSADEAGTPQGLETIVVTAQRRAEAIQDVPIAVSAFDTDAIDRLNSRDISDLTGNVPNLVLSEVAIGPGLAQISIRGVNSQDPEKSFDPAVGVFIDGIYLGTSAFTLLNTFDLERIEVLRGPQGTLFGRNTTGGAINAFRRRPSGEAGVRARATLGNHGRTDFNGEVNLPAIGDVFSLLVRGQAQKDDGQYENAVGGATGRKDRWSVGAALRLNEPGVADVLVTYDHSEDNSELTPYIARGINVVDPLPFSIVQTTFPRAATVVPGFGPDLLCLRAARCETNVSRVNNPHFQDSRLDALSINVDIPVSEAMTFTAIGGIRDSSEKVYIDFDGTDLTTFNVYRGQQYTQYSGEVRLASDFDGPFDFVAGAFFFHSEYSLQQAIKLDLAMAGAAVPVNSLYVNGSGDEDEHSSRTAALFAQVDYHITSQLKFTLGGRASWDRKQIFTRFVGSPLTSAAAYQVTDGIPANRPITSSGGATKSFFEFTPKAMLTFEPTEDSLFYASYTRGYNAGGFSGRAGTVADVTTPFDPEFVTTYELGSKLDLFDRRLRLNVAAFWNAYDNKQEETIQPGPPPSFTSTTVRNAAAARIRGFEIEVSARPIPQLRVNTSLGYLDAQYTDFKVFIGSGQYVSTPAQPAGTLVEADLSSLKLRRAPQWSGAIGATFTADVGFGALSINGNARYVDKQYSEFFNSRRGLIPANWKFDASASIEFGGPNRDRFQVTVFGENLSNKQFFTGFTNSLVDFSTRSQPRMYGVQFAVDF